MRRAGETTAFRLFREDSMNERMKELKSRLGEVYDLGMSTAVLRWDMSTYMPPGGADARGRQLALLSRLAHERQVDPAIGRLLDALEKDVAKLPMDSDDYCLVRAARRDFEQASRIPVSLVGEMESHFSHAYNVWTEARPANDFHRVRPLLEKTLDLSRRLADCFPGYAHVADPLIDFSDYGMKTADIRRIFGDLRGRLVPVVRAITSRPPADDACLRHDAEVSRQLAFGLEVIERYGYDFNRGRQDMTHHPFMTKFSLGDVRITTRARKNDLTDSLFSTLHEAGHAMYEQGIRMDFEGTPLANGTSSGVHESQSRLWENQVGRSLEFWTHFYPVIQKNFPAELNKVPLDTFYRAINKVGRTLIRTDADEVTYNLHVMIRFGLELDMLEGKLAVKDLADAWIARYKEDLGVDVKDHKDGVLQDVHWFSATIGGVFQGYTLGNIMAAQFFAKAKEAHPDIPQQIQEGEFKTLHGWLKDNIYQHGSKFTPDELLQRVTGGPLSTEPYMDYLWGKFQPMYDLRDAERAAEATAG
jgi:carboxypeptidase Taq